VGNQVRENLREAIAQSGLVIKEIAEKSKVKKATIDNWVGNPPTMPRAIDLVMVAQVLGVTADWIVTGKVPNGWRAPSRIAPIVDDLMILDDNELETVAVMIHPLAEAHRAKRTTGTGPPPEQQALGT
jgi:transcriptional regulator with XRE-family HTH domain